MRARTHHNSWVSGVTFLVLTVSLSACTTEEVDCADLGGACAVRDETRCYYLGSAVETCTEREDGCLVWHAQACADHEVCDRVDDDAACVTVCTDECAEAIYPACSADGGAVETCKVYSDGCTDLITTDCGALEICDDSGAAPVCVAVCTDECLGTDYPRCSDDNTALETCELGAEGCTVVVSTPCGPDLICDDAVAACAFDCTDECVSDDYPVCSGDLTAVVTCEVQADGCTDLLTVLCDAGEQCEHTGPDPVCAGVPQATVSPPSGSPLGTAQAIVVTFDRSMDPASLFLAGDIGTAMSAWSTTSVPDDTLTFTPESAWVQGFSRTHEIIDVESTAGESMSLLMVYDVLSAPTLTYLYVDVATGHDIDNDGLTPATPKQTIMAAVDAAAGPSAVLVAEGTYLVNSDPGVATHVVMKEAVSLYGGYAPGFALRDASTHVSQVTDESTAIGMNNTTLLAPSSAFVTAATVVDGFSILGGGGTVSSAVLTSNASPTLRHNVILGGTAEFAYGAQFGNGSAALVQENRISGGNAVSHAWGVYLEFSMVVLERNVIDGGTAGNNTLGIQTISSSNDSIRNNTIEGGSGAVTSIGIEADGDVVVANNTVDGGYDNTYSIAMGYDTGAVVTINNLLFATGGTYRICYNELSGSTQPAELYNNDMFDCPDGVYVDHVGGNGGDCSFNSSFNCLLGIANVNGLTDFTGGVGGNVSIDPLFEDRDNDDLHLTPSSPQTVREGGLDLSGSFPDDKDGVLRTVPWSIGAYEQD